MMRPHFCALRCGNAARVKDKLRAIRDAGMRIQRLARDLVTYAKPSGARTEPVDLAGVAVVLFVMTSLGVLPNG